MNDNAKRIVEEQTLNLLNSGAVLSEKDKNILNDIVTKIGTIYETPISQEKEEREAQYNVYRDLITSYGKTLGETKYNLLLTKDEFLYLKNLILKRLDYDRQNLFVGLLVRDNFFYKYDSEKNATKTSLFTENQVEAFPLDINEITRISHLTGLHNIQGLDNKADLFANIIKKIGDISKIFDVYNSRGQELSEQGGNWLQGFEKYDTEEVEVEQVQQ
jgi:hypothetical protein